MLVRLELDQEAEEIFIRSMARYIPHDLIVSFIYAFGDDFSLILSILEGRTIRVPSIKIIRSMVGNIKLYLKVKEQAGDKEPTKEVFAKIAQQEGLDIPSVKKSYTKIDVTLRDWDNYMETENEQ